MPEASAVVVPMTPMSARERVTVWPGPAVPARTSVGSLVTASLEDAPVSVTMPLMTGVVMLVSTLKAAESGPALPAASVALAVKVWLPGTSWAA